jgi:hypothetical protein
MGKFRRMRDEEIERLLAGDGDDDIERVLSVLRNLKKAPVDEQLITRHVDDAVTASLRPKRRLGRPIPMPTKRHVRLLRKPALVGLLSTVTLVIGLSGVAWAANSSKPGDSLYGIDRAFEALGIGNGGSEERLSEIRALFDAGDLTRMLDHVNNVIPRDSVGTATASEALRAAARSVVERGAVASTDTLSAVSELLDYLSTNLHGVDASEIEKFAGHIRTRGFEAPDTGLTPADPTDPSGFREDG